MLNHLVIIIHKFKNPKYLKKGIKRIPIRKQSEKRYEKYVRRTHYNQFCLIKVLEKEREKLK